VIDTQSPTLPNETVHSTILIQENKPDIIEELCHAIEQLPSVHKVTPFFITVETDTETKSSHKRNPYSTGRPIAGGGVGIFFGRQEEIQTIWRALDGWENHSVMLWGQQRIGKTSLLNQIKEQTGVFCPTPRKGIFQITRSGVSEMTLPPLGTDTR
jgi:putative ribosome biogenesis GTPase RsgA